MPSAGAIQAGGAWVTVGIRDRTKGALQSIENRLFAFGNAIGTIGRNLTFLGVGASAGVGALINKFTTFDDSMRQVRAVTGATIEQFKDLTQVALKLGATTSFTARQVADLMVILGRAGLDDVQIKASTKSILDLSRATGVALPRAGEIAVDIVRSFKKEISDTPKVVDLLVATANSSSQTLEELFESMKLIGPVATLVGEDMDTVAAQLGVLANAGIKASLAGTAMRRAFVNLADEDIQARLKGVGISAVDAAGDLRKTFNIMAQIGQVARDKPSAEALQLFADVFGIRGINVANLANATDQFDLMLKKISLSKDIAATSAKIMDEGMGGALRMLASAAESAAIRIGDVLSGALIKLTMQVRDLIESRLIPFIQANKELVLLLPLVAVGLTGVGISFIMLNMAAKAGAIAMMLLTATYSATLGPIFAVIAATKIHTAAVLAWRLSIVAAGATAAGLSGILWTLSKAMMSLAVSTRVLTAAYAAMAFVARTTAAATTLLITTTMAARLAFTLMSATLSVLPAIGAAVMATFGALKVSLIALSAVAAFTSVVFKVLGATIGIIATVIGIIKSPIIIAAGAVLALIGVIGTLAISGGDLQGAFSSLASTVGGMLTETFKNFRAVLGGIYDALSSGNFALAAQIAMAGLKNVFIRGMNQILGLFGANISDLLLTLQLFWINVQHFAGLAVLAVQKIWLQVKTVFINIANSILSLFGTNLSAVMETLSKWGKNLMKFFGTIWDFIKEIARLTGKLFGSAQSGLEKSAAQAGLKDQFDDLNKSVDEFNEKMTKARKDAVKSRDEGLGIHGFLDQTKSDEEVQRLNEQAKKEKQEKDDQRGILERGRAITAALQKMEAKKLNAAMQKKLDDQIGIGPPELVNKKQERTIDAVSSTSAAVASRQDIDGLMDKTNEILEDIKENTAEPVLGSVPSQLTRSMKGEYQNLHQPLPNSGYGFTFGQ